MEQLFSNSCHSAGGAILCPRCGQEGRTVSSVTIESLVSPVTRSRLCSLDGFCFCATPACTVAYFHSTSGELISCPDVVVPIFQKSIDPERLVCYCFQHTVAAIQREVRDTGTSRIATDIKANCAQALGDCERTNPEGTCCLGNIQRVIREAAGTNQPSTPGGGECCGH